MAYSVRVQAPSLPESRREDPPLIPCVFFFFFARSSQPPPASQTRGGSRRLQVRFLSSTGPHFGEQPD